MSSTTLPRTTLSVNLNKVALVRNSRLSGIPSVTHAATLCLQAGAHGITVHPRPDERHIRPSDVVELATLLQDWPQCEFNIEGNPLHNLMDIAEELVRRKLPIHQLTFVPDVVDQRTSDHGWNLVRNAAALAPCIKRARGWGIRVSMFVDPDAEVMPHAHALGADRVELYTEPFAAVHGTPQEARELDRLAQAADAARQCGLNLNAGHDLDRVNLVTLLGRVPQIREVSIGHALIADALEMGYTATVHAYLRSIDEGLRRGMQAPSPPSPSPAGQGELREAASRLAR
ncbi:pyridoxine 5'-phosphate synthase [Candidatus Symbiobacter mobilis]|uniref:Pyridoxine 5'-phosphate synthase n=1 Tax=Candidatus Symbiobacter mobilis CR TaxID=946483 RepID=U5NAJ0_9BURK|nr:pyridoxine 5'-phosphate synthase [Candidatus Symbiobacter mobilis]AGX88576.1 pyridoxine 5-phosphate synthase [Candidatus Symbiobacter mobilis CR]